MSVQTGDVVRVANIMGGFASDQYVNVWYVQYNSAPIGNDQTVADDLALLLDSFYNGIAPFQRSTLTYARTTNKNVTRDELMPDSVFPTTTSGGSAADALPPQVAALAIGRTLKSRVQRRLYLPGLIEAENVSGIVQAPLAAALLTATAQWLITNTINGRLYDNVVYNVALDTFQTIVSSFVVADFRTQRRRTRGRGF